MLAPDDPKNVRFERRLSAQGEEIKCRLEVAEETDFLGFSKYFFGEILRVSRWFPWLF